MLLSRQKRRARRPELELAAMIDVVFLLLIFFMCTSSFARPEETLRAHTPTPGAAADEAPLDPVRIRLRTVPEGVLVTCDGRSCADFEALGALLEDRRRLASLPVIIRGGPAVPLEYMVAALDTSYGAGFEKVAYSTDTRLDR